MRPVIGITSRRSDAEWVERNTRHYVEAVERVGAAAVVLAPDRAVDGLTGLDGLLLSGGGDVDPSYYGEAVNGSELHRMDRARDELELDLARAALARDMPVFGICRGHQVLNVACGGSLLQHTDTHRVPGGTAWVQHGVRIVAGTRVSAIFGGRAEIVVNSRHHQAVTPARLAAGLVAAAVTWPDDGTLEAVESPAHAWVVGVQWHPERVVEVPAEHAALFDAFAEAARDYARGQRTITSAPPYPGVAATSSR